MLIKMEKILNEAGYKAFIKDGKNIVVILM